MRYRVGKYGFSLCGWNPKTHKAWAVSGGRFIRAFSDGITFLEVEADFTRHGDHSPKLDFSVIILNLMLLELEWYDTRHEEDK